MMRSDMPCGKVLMRPLGISMTSQLRFKTVWVFEVILLLRGYRLLFAFDGSFECVPCQGGAFHAHGKLRYSRKNRQLPKIILIPVRLAGSHQLMKNTEQLGCFRLAFAFDRLRHHRSRSFRNSAARTLKAHIPNRVAFHFE